MSRPKINDKKLLKLIGSGKTQAEVGRDMGVTRQAVNQRLQELNQRTTKGICTISKNSREVISNNLDIIGQLKKINDKANQLLDDLENDPNTAVRIMSEIRWQLKLQLDMFEILYSVQAAQEFQNEVLQAIGEADDDTRQRIINKLNQKRSIRSSVQWA